MSDNTFKHPDIDPVGIEVEEEKDNSFKHPELEVVESETTFSHPDLDKTETEETTVSETVSTTGEVNQKTFIDEVEYKPIGGDLKRTTKRVYKDGKKPKEKSVKEGSKRSQEQAFEDIDELIDKLPFKSGELDRREIDFQEEYGITKIPENWLKGKNNKLKGYFRKNPEVAIYLQKVIDNWYETNQKTITGDVVDDPVLTKDILKQIIKDDLIVGDKYSDKIKEYRVDLQSQPELAAALNKSEIKNLSPLMLFGGLASEEDLSDQQRKHLFTPDKSGKTKIESVINKANEFWSSRDNVDRDFELQGFQYYKPDAVADPEISIIDQGEFPRAYSGLGSDFLQKQASTEKFKSYDNFKIVLKDKNTGQIYTADSELMTYKDDKMNELAILSERIPSEFQKKTEEELGLMKVNIGALTGFVKEDFIENGKWNWDNINNLKTENLNLDEVWDIMETRGAEDPEGRIENIINNSKLKGFGFWYENGTLYADVMFSKYAGGFGKPTNEFFDGGSRNYWRAGGKKDENGKPLKAPSIDLTLDGIFSTKNKKEVEEWIIENKRNFDKRFIEDQSILYKADRYFDENLGWVADVELGDFVKDEETKAITKVIETDDGFKYEQVTVNQLDPTNLEAAAKRDLTEDTSGVAKMLKEEALNIIESIEVNAAEKIQVKQNQLESLNQKREETGKNIDHRLQELLEIKNIRNDISKNYSEQLKLYAGDLLRLKDQIEIEAEDLDLTNEQEVEKHNKLIREYNSLIKKDTDSSLLNQYGKIYAGGFDEFNEEWELVSKDEFPTRYKINPQTGERYTIDEKTGEKVFEEYKPSFEQRGLPGSNVTDEYYEQRGGGYSSVGGFITYKNKETGIELTIPAFEAARWINGQVSLEQIDKELQEKGTIQSQEIDELLKNLEVVDALSLDIKKNIYDTYVDAMFMQQAPTVAAADLVIEGSLSDFLKWGANVIIDSAASVTKTVYTLPLRAYQVMGDITGAFSDEELKKMSNDIAYFQKGVDQGYSSLKTNPNSTWQNEFNDSIVGIVSRTMIEMAFDMATLRIGGVGRAAFNSAKNPLKTVLQNPFKAASYKQAAKSAANINFPAFAREYIRTDELMNDPRFDNMSEGQKFTYAMANSYVIAKLDKLGLDAVSLGSPTAMKVIDDIIANGFKFGNKSNISKVIDGRITQLINDKVIKPGVNISKRAVSGMPGEMITENLQDLSSLTMEDMANFVFEMDGKADLMGTGFQNVDWFSRDFWDQVAMTTLVSGIASGGIGTIHAGAQTVFGKKGGSEAAAELSRKQVNLMRNQYNKENVDVYRKHLNQQVLDGELSEQEANQFIKDAEKMQGILEKIPYQAKPKDQQAALVNLLKLEELNSQIEENGGKDNILNNKLIEDKKQVEENLRQLSNKVLEQGDFLVPQKGSIGYDHYVNRLNEDLESGKITQKQYNDAIKAADTELKVKDTEVRKDIVKFNKRIELALETIETSELATDEMMNQYADKLMEEVAEENITLEQAEQKLIDMSSSKVNIRIAENSKEADEIAAEEGVSMLDSEGNRAHATITPDMVIIVDKEASIRLGGEYSIEHEAGHWFIKKTIDNAVKTGNEDVVYGLANAALQELKDINKDDLKNSELIARIEGYEQDTEITDLETAEEVLMLLSDAISKEDVKIDRKGLKGLRQKIKDLFSTAGVDAEIETGADVISLLKNFKKSLTRGKLTEKQQKIVEEGAKVSKKIATTKEELDITKQDVGVELQKDKTTWDPDTTPKAKKSKGVNIDIKATNQEIKTLQDEKAKIIEQQKIAAKEGNKKAIAENVEKIKEINKKSQILEDIVTIRTGEGGVQKAQNRLVENTKDDVNKTAKAITKSPKFFAGIAPEAATQGMGVSTYTEARQLYESTLQTDLATMIQNEWNPSIEPDLAKFVRNRGYLRAYSLATKLGVADVRQGDQGITKDLETAKNLSTEEDTEGDIDKKPKVTVEPIMVHKRLGPQAVKINEQVREMTKDLDPSKLTYKSLKDLVPDLTQEMFGVIPKVGNLTKGDIQNAQMFIAKNADALISMLPEGATPSGTATGVQNVLLKEFYTKSEKPVKFKGTGSKAQLYPFIKNPNISKSDFLSVFGITQQGEKNLYKKETNTSSRIKAIIDQTGRILTNQAVRMELMEQQVPEAVIQKIGEGKSKAMFSKPAVKKAVINLGKGYRQIEKLGHKEIYIGGLPEFISEIDALASSPKYATNEIIDQAWDNVYGNTPLARKNKKGTVLVSKQAIVNEWKKVVDSIRGKEIQKTKKKPEKVDIQEYLYKTFDEQTDRQSVSNILGADSKLVDFTSKDALVDVGNGLVQIIKNKNLNTPEEVFNYIVNDIGKSIYSAAKIGNGQFNYELRNGVPVMVDGQSSRSNSVRYGLFKNPSQAIEVLGLSVLTPTSIQTNQRKSAIPWSEFDGKSIIPKRGATTNITFENGDVLTLGWKKDSKGNYKMDTPKLNGEKIAKPVVPQKVDPYLKDIFNNGGISSAKLDESAEFAKKNQETLIEILDQYKSDKDLMTPESMAMIFLMSNGNMESMLRASARVDSFGLSESTNPSDYRYEHNPPARVMQVYMAQYLNGDINRDTLLQKFNDFTISIIPKQMDEVINTRYKDTIPDTDNKWDRYYSAYSYGEFKNSITEYVKQEDGTYKKVVHGKYQEEAYDEVQRAKQKFSKSMNNSKVVKIDPKKMVNEDILSLAITMDNALLNAANPNAPVKKIRVFDFDDTLAQTDSRVIYNKPNTTGKPATKLKAVLMAGSPGGGKSSIVEGLGLEKQGYKIVNQDVFLEWAKNLVGLPESEIDYDAVQRSVRGEMGALAKKVAEKDLEDFTDAGDGVVVDGTGASLKATKAKIKALQDKGYEVSMVYVNTSKDTALDRNRARKERSLPDFIVERTWDSVNANKEAYIEEFGDKFFEVETDNLKRGEVPSEFVNEVNSKLNATERGMLDAGQFAHVSTDMEAEGATWDFSQFNQVIDGREGPLLQVAKKIQEVRGSEDIFVLTARAPQAATAIHEYLNSVGLNIPLENITGLGDGSPFAKSQWMVEKAGEGYNDFYFADDHLSNVEAVDDALSQMQVVSRVQQAKVKESKKELTEELNNELEKTSGKKQKFSFDTKKQLDWKRTKEFYRNEFNTSTKVGSQKVNIRLTEVEKGSWELDFGVGEKKFQDSIGKLGITGKGDAYRIFSVVGNGVTDLINRQGLKEINFSALEPSRARVYETFTKLWAKRLGWEFEADVYLDGSGSYTIRKPGHKSARLSGLSTSEASVKSKRKKQKFSLNTKRDLDWKQHEENDRTFISKFKIGDKKYEVILADYSGRGNVEFAFARVVGEDRVFDMIGDGNAYEIISIVTNGLVDLVKSNKIPIKEIVFSADRPSRARVYERIAKMWANELGWNMKRYEGYSETGADFAISRQEWAQKLIDQKVDRRGFEMQASDPAPKDFETIEPFTPEEQAAVREVLQSQQQNAGVRQVLSQVDRKSPQVRQSQMFSKGINETFNKIIENKTGIGAEKVFGDVKAKVRGRGKGKFNFFIPPSAEDFAGLLYKTLGKGKIGDEQMKFYKRTLFDPYAKAMGELTVVENKLRNDFRELKDTLVKKGIVPKNLNKKIKTDGKLEGYTYQDVIRILAWDMQGIEVDGLTKTDLIQIKKFAEQNPDINTFAQELIAINKGDGYVYPGRDWLAGTITTDLIDGLKGEKRSKILKPWQDNVDIMFSRENMNKLRAAYGDKYVEALENMLARMRTGTNRLTSGKYARIENQLLDYLNNSVGAVMFYNTRSAVLQTISLVNFVNWKDNNPLAAAKAFGNQKQFWTDFLYIMNSDFLVNRRNGLKLNVSESEIADAAAREKNKVRGVMAYIMEKGFTFTKMGDSFAIAFGGATFYRNRVKKYISDGMTEENAQKQAWRDFREVAEESQQSSRPDRISQQQASNIGRVILAFANTPSQYARIIKKSFSDLINGRGDWKTNMSRIAYYGAVQNLIFTTLQNALMFMMWDDEEDEEEKKKYYRTANSMMDNILRGLGYGGALVSMLKNVGIDIYERSKPENQGYKGPQYWKSTFELLSFSPPLDVKITKFQKALENWEYNSWRPETSEPFSIDNPIYKTASLLIASTTNLPLDRLLQKAHNIRDAFDEDQANWKRVALLAGWPEWQLMSSSEKEKKIEDERKLKKEIRAKDKPSLWSKEEQQSILKQHGYSDEEILEMNNEDLRTEAILKAQKETDKVYTPDEKIKVVKPKKSQSRFKSKSFNKTKFKSKFGGGDKALYDMTKSEQVDSLGKLGLSEIEIKALRYEKDRVEKIIELNKNK